MGEGLDSLYPGRRRVSWRICVFFSEGEVSAVGGGDGKCKCSGPL